MLEAKARRADMNSNRPVEPWSVQLPAGLAAPARETAKEVASRLRDPDRLRRAVREAPQQSLNPDYVRWRPQELACGHAGLAVVFANCADAFPDEDWEVAARAHLEVAAEARPKRSDASPSLFHGLAGLAVASHLIGHDIAVEGELASATEAALDRVRASEAGLAVEDFDVVSGLAGIGACLLQVGDPAPVLEALVYLARPDELPAWHTPPRLLSEQERERYRDGYLNCGLAHGIPGPLALLALAEGEGVRVAGAPEAIERIADWLVEQCLEDEWGTTWPAVVPLGPEQPEATRSAWCYGPPGVARSLWHAGEALDDSSYRDIALEAMAAVYRRPETERRIDSPTFCHGVAGLLQITLRFWHETKLPLFGDAAADLTEQLLAAYEPESILGYRDVEPDGRKVDYAGLVGGAAGVALVLLAASSPVDPGWDRMFLLS